MLLSGNPVVHSDLFPMSDLHILIGLHTADCKACDEHGLVWWVFTFLPSCIRRLYLGISFNTTIEPVFLCKGPGSCQSLTGHLRNINSTPSVGTTWYPSLSCHIVLSLNYSGRVMKFTFIALCRCDKAWINSLFYLSAGRNRAHGLSE